MTDKQALELKANQLGYHWVNKGFGGWQHEDGTALYVKLEDIPAIKLNYLGRIK